MKPVAISLSLLTASALALALSMSVGAALAIETSPAVTLGGAEFNIDGDDKEHERERKEIEATFANIEALYNAHNLDGVMANYSDDYVNNDGLDKKTVTKLTQEFWKNYPDARSTSKTKQIRIEGTSATVESRDVAVGTTFKNMPGMDSKGELQSLSESQTYLKRFGTTWKIVGDRIDYEKVKVAFGLAKQLNATFTAPEQVKAGKQYSARLEVNLPPGLFAVGSITSQPLRYPQPTPTDSPRPLEQPVLERVMGANSENRNELLTATVILTNPMRTSVMGVSFLTRRMNVIPEHVPVKDEVQVAESEEKKSIHLTSEKAAPGKSQEKAADKALEKSTEKETEKATEKAVDSVDLKLNDVDKGNLGKQDQDSIKPGAEVKDDSVEIKK